MTTDEKLDFLFVSEMCFSFSMNLKREKSDWVKRFFWKRIDPSTEDEIFVSGGFTEFPECVDDCVAYVKDQSRKPLGEKLV